MKKLLYIDHTYHNKTKSSQFLQEILKTKYEITTFDYDPFSDSFEKFESLNGLKFDIVILFQIMPPIKDIKNYLSFKKIVFFPMYDGAPEMDDIIWFDYKKCCIINFSKTLHEKCKQVGLASFYIQYFPKPKEILNEGNEKNVFLWQRTDKVTIDTIEKTLDVDKIDNLYLHKAIDPGFEFIEPNEKWKNKTKISTWFDTKEEMNNYMQECAIYYAPRAKEGIGMSFLEAMATARCVIAPDCATMNEYIEHGVNGFLYSLKKPHKIKLDNIKQIQKNAYEYIQKGYIEWENKKNSILDWIEINPNRHINYRLLNKTYQNTLKDRLFKKIKNGNKRTILLFGFIKINYKKSKK